jgi:hypothetical protein
VAWVGCCQGDAITASRLDMHGVACAEQPHQVKSQHELGPLMRWGHRIRLSEHMSTCCTCRRRIGDALQSFLCACTAGTYDRVIEAERVWSLYQQAPPLAMFHEPVMAAVNRWRSLRVDHSLIAALEMQTPADTAQLIRAAGVVAATHGDAEAIRFVARGLAAAQRGDIKFVGDLASLECLRYGLYDRAQGSMEGGSRRLGRDPLDSHKIAS